MLIAIFLFTQASLALAGEDDKLLATDLKVGSKIYLKRDLDLSKCGADMFINLGTGDCTPNTDNIITGRKCVIGPLRGNGISPPTPADNYFEKGSSIEVTGVKAEDNSFITVQFRRGPQKGLFTCARDFIDIRQTSISMASLQFNVRKFLQIDNPIQMKALMDSLPKGPETPPPRSRSQILDSKIVLEAQAFG